MSTYEQQKQLEQTLTRDHTPTMSSADILSSIKLIKQIKEDVISKDDVHPGLSWIASEELKYVDAAMTALKKNKMLSNIYGNSFEGAMKLASLLKSHHNKKVYDTVLDGVLLNDQNANADAESVRLTAPLHPNIAIAENNNRTGIS